jgi:leucyl/phenylalanyl-tRNA--protein transferase
MILAYTNLNRLGKAHSVEVWQDGEIVGGAYGVAIGAMFCGESMFSTIPNASKVALVHLSKHLASIGFKIIDCQLETDHLVSMGGQPIPRTEFLKTIYRLRDQQLCWSN